MSMLNLNLDYNFAKPKEPLSCPKCKFEFEGHPEQPTNVQLTLNYLRAAVAIVHSQGLNGQQRRIWGRIDRSLDSAEESKSTNIEVEKAGIDFLKSVFSSDEDSGKRHALIFDSRFAKYFVILEDEIDRLITQPKHETQES